MSLSLPAQDSELRDHFDVDQLVNWRDFPLFPNAVRGLRAYVAAEKAAVCAFGMCLKHDGTVNLIRVGKRGAVKVAWNFGDPTTCGPTHRAR